MKKYKALFTYQQMIIREIHLLANNKHEAYDLAHNTIDYLNESVDSIKIYKA